MVFIFISIILVIYIYIYIIGGSKNSFRRAPIICSRRQPTSSNGTLGRFVIYKPTFVHGIYVFLHYDYVKWYMIMNFKHLVVCVCIFDSNTPFPVWYSA